MPIQSNLTVSPYFDDYRYESDYYRVLFKPSTAVQVRELNQLQAILQRQIEEFGDIVLKRGTLLDGCQASFSPDIPFVKILDVTVEGTAVDLASYVGLFARGDEDNVIARVSDAINGFEAQDPNLKTLYLKYLNSGDSLNSNGFIEGETLTIFNNDYRLYDISIADGSEGFSNTDKIVIVSAIEVQNSSGGTTFTAPIQQGDVLSSDSREVEVLSVDTTANTDAVTLRIKPTNTNLTASNTGSWQLAVNDELESDANVKSIFVSRVIGSGAQANFSTLRSGKISSITMVSGGAGYTTLPHVTLSGSPASNTELDTLELNAENFTARVEIATNGERGIQEPTTGVGYGMSVTEGKIYQKGQFLRVDGQNIIVSKYSSTSSNTPGPDGVAVGFVTQEFIANSAVDPTLNDNAGGFLNQNAPGADRLQLIPKLAVKTLAEADSDSQFFPIYKFSEGLPYSQRTDVQFNKLADEMARRTYEESGNYVLNPFEITTRSAINISNFDTTFTYLIDPGLAYINGYRVETLQNFAKNVPKGTDETTVANTSLDLVYGNYVRCNEFVGLHNFSTAQIVELHGTPGDAISGFAGALGDADPNDQIGTARIRSIVHESGIQGTSSAVYRIYLFDIRMNSGRNFRNVKSLFVDGQGVADIVTEPDGRGNDIAVLKENKANSLLFTTRRPVKSFSNINYRYRTSREGLTIGTNGVIASFESANGAQWPSSYSNVLTTAQENELIVIPENDLVSSSTLTGVITIANTEVTGTNTQFTSELQVGDYIRENDSNTIAVITSISDDETATIEPPLTATDATFTRVYPSGVPISIATRTDASATLSGDRSTLSIDTGLDLTQTDTVTVVYTQEVAGATPVSKTAQRNVCVKLDLSTNDAGTTGPWCLGVPDVFRLRGVYEGTDNSGNDVTSEFYVDHNQTENYYGLSYLYLRNDSSLELTSSDDLFVEFDCFTRSVETPGGVITLNSHTIDDEKVLSDLTTAVNTLELSEVITKDEYYDLRETFDFRPAVKNTATITSNNAAATVNPDKTDFTQADLFSTGADIKFPVPEGDLNFDMTYYEPRVDTILLNSTGDFEFMLGKQPTEINPNQFPLYRVNVPPYPTLPKNPSTAVRELLDKKVSSVGIFGFRKERFTVITESLRKQIQGYTMEEISQLERRISILEYYTNLSETENRIKELSIPSSVDSTIERFKFGFYVDNFSDYQFSNVQDPEYSATIFEYVLQPASANYNIPLKVSKATKDLLSGKRVAFPYQRKNLVSQTFATTGPPPPVEEVITEPPEQQGPIWSRVCQSIINRDRDWTEVNTPAQYLAANNIDDWTGKVEQSVFTLTSNTDAQGQTFDLYFNLDYGTDRIIVEQSRSSDFAPATTSRIFNTRDQQDQVDDLTEEDKRYLRNQRIESYYYPEPEDWNDLNWSDEDPNDAPLINSRNAGFLKWMGKFSISYNPANGRYFRVTIHKAGPFFLYHVCYPADAIEDPIYNTYGFANKGFEDAPKDIDTTGDSSPNCPPSLQTAIAIANGFEPDRCKQPIEEEPPRCSPEPDPDPDEETEVEVSYETNDPGKKRGKGEEEDVYYKGGPGGYEVGISGSTIPTTSNNTIGNAIDQVDSRPIRFSDILFGRVKISTK